MMDAHDRRTGADDDDEGELPARLVVGGMPVHPVWAAAIAGSALAAGAGAYLGARALAKRNSQDGRVNSALAAAITAFDVSHPKKDEAA
jgi:hypothetical protein